METWLIKNALQLVIMLVAVISGFLALKFLISELRKTVQNIDKRTSANTYDLERHKTSKLPHTNCAVHTANYIVTEKVLALKMDREPCVKIHESIDRRLDEMGESLKSLTNVLAPLGAMQDTLNRIESKVDKNKDLIIDGTTDN
jgi:hypothetical protein